ncbi:energy-coupled thiamine transporter ThiT [Bacillus xiapuensis]|uniref:energy-coupled thiamine transporter ThiT n=1 Tax=Bacillus xiapuensis TaxID=2014075 RepID=UPI000C24C1E2|nr:energy-coupled thiamine transporter ThiT [Bacillus xiapuensis]
MDRTRLVTMIEIAVMAGLAHILSYVKFEALWAFGGSISLVMVPVFLMAFRRGWKAGVTTGLIVGCLGLMFGGYIVHPIQLVLDYPLAFAVLGFAGIVSSKEALSAGKIIGGLLLGTLLRLLCHFISGIVWFGEAAPEDWPVALYSLAYNASYLIPEMLVTAVALVFLLNASPSFFKHHIQSVNRSASV